MWVCVCGSDLLKSCDCGARGSASGSSTGPTVQGWFPLQKTQKRLHSFHREAPPQGWACAGTCPGMPFLTKRRWGVGPGAAHGEPPSDSGGDVCGTGGT